MNAIKVQYDDPTGDMFAYFPPREPPLIADLLKHAARVRVATEQRLRQQAQLLEQEQAQRAGAARPTKPPTTGKREEERRMRQLARGQIKQRE